VNETLERHFYKPHSQFLINKKEAETNRVMSIRETLVRCNGTCVSFDSQRTGSNLIGVSRIEIIKPEDWYVALLHMMEKDNATHNMDIWGSETLSVDVVYSPFGAFPFWRFLLMMWRMGFRTNDICSTAMYVPESFGVNWEHIFKYITSWTFTANSFCFDSHVIYYAKVMSDISHHIVTSLKLKCAICGLSVKMVEGLDHPMVCNVQHVCEASSHVKPSKKRMGQHLQPGTWTNDQSSAGVQETSVDQPKTSKKRKYRKVQTGSSTFNSFEFRGPSESELRGRLFLSLPSGTEEVLKLVRDYRKLAPPLTQEEEEH
jgi:hypothetical protein